MLGKTLALASVGTFGLLLTFPQQAAGVECSTSLVNLDLLGFDWLYEACVSAASLITWSDYTDECNILTSTDTSSSGSSSSSTSNCGEDVCSAAEYQLSATADISSEILESYGIDGSIASLLSGEFDTSFSVSSEFCGYNALCLATFGSTSGTQCTTLDFSFGMSIPTSCNAASDYDRLSVSYGYAYSLLCCDGNSCNDGFFGSGTESCDTATVDNTDDMTSALGTCWDNIQEDFLTYLFCNISDVDFSDTCITSTGAWDTSNPDCAEYQDPCSQTILDWLQYFGDCMCDAVPSDEYGEMIGTLMDFVYSNVCPGLTITCENGDATITGSFTYLVFSLGMSAASTAFDDDALSDIKTILGSLGDVSTAIIGLDVEDWLDDDSASTLINVSMRTGSESIALAIETTMFGDDGNSFTTNWEAKTTELEAQLTTYATVSEVAAVTEPYTYSTGTAASETTTDGDTTTPDGESITGSADTAEFERTGTLIWHKDGEAGGVLVVCMLPLIFGTLASVYMRFRKDNMPRLC